MIDEAKFVLALAVLIGVYLLTRRVNGWRAAKALNGVIRDLRREEAFAPSSAIALPYAKVGLFSLGMRDFRPRAVQTLLASGIVGMTQEGKYYLKERSVDLGIEKSHGGKGVSS
ncbi:MAG: hypothetical protein JW821_14215 [Deltaproteobacteria bacterium]|nr:hypothetical protein [Deltaproteobacteria bacterium]